MSDVTPDLRELVPSLSGLARRAVDVCAPIVEDIVRAESRDVRRIEHTLDGLLGFRFDPEALRLFKRPCRHDWSFDPVATASHIPAYREMGDSEPEAPPGASARIEAPGRAGRDPTDRPTAPSGPSRCPACRVSGRKAYEDRPFSAGRWYRYRARPGSDRAGS